MPRSSAAFKAGFIVQPTPDGGTSSRTAGPVIQSNWESLRDSGVSAEDATARLHTLGPPTTSGAVQPPASPWWVNGQQFNSDPHQAVMHGPTTANNGTASTYEIGPRYTNSYGPVADILNRRQPTLA